MFSGIVQATGRVQATREAKGIRRVSVEMPRGWKLKKGASVSVDGICSTIVALKKNSFDVEYMPETRSKTTAASFAKGRTLNLERSLTLGDSLDAHFVAGHVDGVARVSSATERGSSVDISIDLPHALSKFAAPQGSITLNGVGLTVARKKGNTVTVSLIPYTLAHTNLGTLRKGDEVNVEVDLLARYLAALLKK